MDWAAVITAGMALKAAELGGRAALLPGAVTLAIKAEGQEGDDAVAAVVRLSVGRADGLVTVEQLAPSEAAVGSANLCLRPRAALRLLFGPAPVRAPHNMDYPPTR